MARSVHGLTKYDMLVRACANGVAMNKPLPQVFGRIGPHNPITGAAPDGSPFSADNLLDAFGDTLDEMLDKNDPQDGDVAAGMTFFGQFVDHDITLDATSSIGKRIDPVTIRNVRTPGLDLDCVYGDGPDATPHLYSKDHFGFLLFGTDENHLDVARTCKGVALIGDPRNAENHIVSQVQGLFICMHNFLMTKLTGNKTLVGKAFEGVGSKLMEGMEPGPPEIFEAARHIMRMHYQWIVLNDLLPAFVDADVLAKVRHTIEKDDLPKPFKPGSPVMPIEFSGAAYRFGHATVQSEYTMNDGLAGKVPLFETMGFDPVPKDKNIEFKRLLDYPGAGKFDKARPIGRKLAKAIYELNFINDKLKIDGHTLELAESRKLPHRNIFRDRFALELASGQQMARAMGVDEIRAPKELRDRGITKTPLWYYCLHEAESFGGKLGPVGGTIVAGTMIRLLALDPESILRSNRGFVPWTTLGASQDGNYSLGHLAKFVEENRGDIAHAAELRCPD